MIVTWVAFAAGAHAQTSAIENARRDIENTYNFDPTGMSFADQADLAPSLTAPCQLPM